MLYDFHYMTFRKKQNYGSGERVSGGQEVEEGREGEKKKGGKLSNLARWGGPPNPFFSSSAEIQWYLGRWPPRIKTNSHPPLRPGAPSLCTPAKGAWGKWCAILSDTGYLSPSDFPSLPSGKERLPRAIVGQLDKRGWRPRTHGNLASSISCRRIPLAQNFT